MHLQQRASTQEVANFHKITVFDKLTSGGVLDIERQNSVKYAMQLDFWKGDLHCKCDSNDGEAGIGLI